MAMFPKLPTQRAAQQMSQKAQMRAHQDFIDDHRGEIGVIRAYRDQMPAALIDALDKVAMVVTGEVEGEESALFRLGQIKAYVSRWTHDARLYRRYVAAIEALEREERKSDSA